MGRFEVQNKYRINNLSFSHTNQKVCVKYRNKKDIVVYKNIHDIDAYLGKVFDDPNVEDAWSE